MVVPMVVEKAGLLVAATVEKSVASMVDEKVASKEQQKAAQLDGH